MRISLLVDGFNLYYSVRDAIDAGATNDIKWLNIRQMAETRLSLWNDGNASITSYFYFTSLAQHRRDGSVERHKKFIKAQQHFGAEIVYGYFKDKEYTCNKCRRGGTFPAEKETDVNVALKLIELFHKDEADGCFLLSGDGDMLPVLKTAKKLFPAKPIILLFPYGRSHPEMSKHAKQSLLSSADYNAHVMANPLITPSGNINMPKEWK